MKKDREAFLICHQFSAGKELMGPDYASEWPTFFMLSPSRREGED